MANQTIRTNRAIRWAYLAIGILDYDTQSVGQRLALRGSRPEPPADPIARILKTWTNPAKWCRPWRFGAVARASVPSEGMVRLPSLAGGFPPHPARQMQISGFGPAFQMDDPDRLDPGLRAPIIAASLRPQIFPRRPPQYQAPA